MNSLDKHQLALIKADVKKAKLKVGTLSEELVDHICCEVEEQMDKGISFNEAYGSIRERVGVSTLQTIEADTIRIIFRKYTILQKSLKTLSNVSVVLIVIGALFKIMHWPFAGVLLGFGFIFLCFGFFPLSLYMNYLEEKKEKNVLLNLIMPLGGTLFSTGLLFKLFEWPNASVFLLAGALIILVALFLPAIKEKKIKLFQKINGPHAVFKILIICIIILTIIIRILPFHFIKL